MELSERTLPVRMRRIAVVALGDSVRDVLVALAEQRHGRSGAGRSGAAKAPRSRRYGGWSAGAIEARPPSPHFPARRPTSSSSS